MLEVLQSQAQALQARRELQRAGHSALEPGWSRALRRWNLAPGLPVGDVIKSWDVARTLQLLDERVPRNAPILDLGAFCSEVPVALARMGYTAVHGIDLNPEVRKMPSAGKVRYDVGDFVSTDYAEASFDAITAISVIEHGYQPHRLFGEVGRLLRPGGFFVASFDYWPQKIDTETTTFFGLSWRIFSLQEVHEMLAVASGYGLRPLGALRSEASRADIHCAGFDYTFAWIVLVKQ